MGTLDLLSQEQKSMSAMLFLLPFLLCGVHSKHFLVETQDADVQTTYEADGYATNGMKQGEGLMSQQDGRRQFEDDTNGRRQEDYAFGDGRRQECWPWWMCGVGGI